MKRIWKVGLAIVAVIALAGAAVGFVAAQEDSGVPGGGRLGNFIERLAGNLGISQDELETAIDTTQLQMVDEALATGDITEEQAAERRARIEAGETGFFFGGKHQRGFGVKTEVAEFIGVTPDELRAGLESGQSMAQVAEANGVTTAALTEYLLSKVQACVAEALADGKIDQAQADEKLANAPARIEEMVNREGLPERHRGGHEGFRSGGFRSGSASTLEPVGVSPTF